MTATAAAAFMHCLRGNALYALVATRRRGFAAVRAAVRASDADLDACVPLLRSMVRLRCDELKSVKQQISEVRQRDL